MINDELSRSIGDLRKDTNRSFWVFFVMIICLVIVFEVQLLDYSGVVDLSSVSSIGVDKVVVSSDMYIVNSTDSNLSFYLYYEDVSFLNRMFSIYKNEFALCFELLSVDPVVLRPSFTLQKSFNAASVISICPEAAYLHVHSHPNNVCKFSDEDFIFFGESKFVVMGVVCGNDWWDFVFVNRNNESLSIGMIY